MSKSFKEMLAEAKLPRRIVSICMRGDLTAEAQRLEDALETVQTTSGPARLADGGRDETLANELEALREQMRAESVQFELEAHPTHAWRALKAKHPVTSDKPAPIDTVVGADTTPFFNEAVRASIVDPKIDDEDWERLTSVLSDGEWDKLVEAVYALNEQPVSIPFSSRAFAILRTPSDGSESPETKDERPES